MSEKPNYQKLYAAGCSGKIRGSGRDVNQDVAVFFEKEPEGNVGSGNLYVMADGVSGTNRPEVSAAFVAKKVLYDYFRSREYAEANKIAVAIRNANHELYYYAQAERQDLQAAVTAVSVVDGHAVIGTIGDCSVFILRGGVAYKMTEEAGAQDGEGAIQENAIGATDEIIVDILDAIELKADDLIIICSEGLTNFAGKKEFLEASLAETPKEICLRLLDDIERRHPTIDISAIVVKIYDENTIHSVVRQPGTAPERIEVAQAAQDLRLFQATHAQPPASAEAQPAARPNRFLFRLLAVLIAGCIVAGLIWAVGNSKMGKTIFGPRETPTPTIDAVQATLASINATKDYELILQLSFTPTQTATATETMTPTPVPPTETPLPPTDTPQATPDTAGSTPETPRLITSDRDDAEMVFVPEGVFLMGAGTNDASAFGDERPQLSVFLNSFWIDQHEVTNGQYLKCVNEGGCQQNGTLILSNAYYKDHPVMSVTFEQARQYCAWAGKRLPTEFEWEKAARGTDGRIYPWGDDAPTGENATANTPIFERLEGITPDDYGLLPVGTFPKGASPYGALDMAGNVWEWTSSTYQSDTYARLSELADGDGIVVDPEDLAEGTGYVRRGGSASMGEAANYTIFMRTTHRWGDEILESEYLGFRCAKSVE